MSNWLDRFTEVWSIDFEFSCPPGNRPRPVCMVAQEFRSKRLIRIDMWTLAKMSSPPFDVGENSLFVAYFSSAEWSCFLALGWAAPICVLDLWVEFRNHLNGKRPAAGFGLLGCLTYFGLDSIEATEKQDMRELAMSGGPYTHQEMKNLLSYCESDVRALDKLLPLMSPQIDFPRAIIRGRYMRSVAQIEHTGIPIDVETLAIFRTRWLPIKSDLIEAVDSSFHVYEGQRFKVDRFEEYLRREGIPWPTTDYGNLALDDETFRQQERAFPRLAPLRALRRSLSSLQPEKLTVGDDDRNRSMLRPFSSRSGRNQPSTNEFVFGLPAWLRGLIKPPSGKSVAYVDWSQQELGIAAALSGDRSLERAYASGDPYLEFARMAGAVPFSATKATHPAERSAFKICMLATQYGMSEYGLARKLNQPMAFARNLLLQHRETFPVYWAWSQSQVDTAMLATHLRSVFGWKIHTFGGDNPRSLANFPMQANGAEMMRLASSMLTEEGIEVCCPVHDAFLVEGPTSEIEDVVAHTQAIMREAGRVVLSGFDLDSDAKIVRFPDRYEDEDRGRDMWNLVYRLALEAE